MCSPLEGVGISMAKKDLGAPEARKAWCKCCDEFSILCHHEATTNPRYNQMKSDWNEPPPPPLNDINDPTWSVIISIIFFLIGVSYVIRIILTYDD